MTICGMNYNFERSEHIWEIIINNLHIEVGKKEIKEVFFGSGKMVVWEDPEVTGTHRHTDIVVTSMQLTLKAAQRLTE